MNLTDPELQSRLAAEYVLGTLHEKARTRFQKLAAVDRNLQRCVDQWTERFNLLALQVEPVTPPSHLLQQVKTRLGIIDRDAQARDSSIWTNVWSGLMAFAAVIVLTIAITVLVYQPVEDSVEFRPDYIAVINHIKDAAAGPAWIIRADFQGNKILATSIKTQKIADDKSHELWLIFEGKKVPKSLGLLPKTGAKQLKLTVQLIQEMKKAKAVAVSLEPVGGSKTGLPTGAVNYIGNLHSL